MTEQEIPDEVEFVKQADELGLKIVAFVVDVCREDRMAVFQRALCLAMARQLAGSCESAEQLRLSLDFLHAALEHDATSLYLYHNFEEGATHEGGHA